MIEIYRFGNYVNAVDDRKQLLRWLRANIPYVTDTDMKIPKTMPDAEVMKVAKEKEFIFKVV